MQKVRDLISSMGEREKKGKGKEPSMGGGDMCPEFMNILIVGYSGVRNLKAWWLL